MTHWLIPLIGSKWFIILIVIILLTGACVIFLNLYLDKSIELEVERKDVEILIEKEKNKIQKEQLEFAHKQRAKKKELELEAERLKELRENREFDKNLPEDFVLSN